MNQISENNSWKPSSLPYNRETDDNCRLVILHYWATWNLHNREQERYLEKLTKTLTNPIDIRSWDVDAAKDEQLCPKRQILNIPAVGIVHYGSLKEVAVGLRNTDQLHDFIQAWFVKLDISPGRAGG